VLHQLGLSTPRSWNIDGHTLSSARPASSASARVRGGRLVAKLSLGSSPRARGIDFHLPARVKGAAAVRVNGVAVDAVTEGKSVRVTLPGRRLHKVSLTADTGRASGSVVVILHRPGGKMAIPLD
jgi:hypothetical protein